MVLHGRFSNIYFALMFRGYLSKCEKTRLMRVFFLWRNMGRVSCPLEGLLSFEDGLLSFDGELLSLGEDLLSDRGEILSFSGFTLAREVNTLG